MSDDFTATLPRKRMAAGVLLSDGRDRVLLVEPTYKPYWEIPGGTVEAERVAARRGRTRDRGGARPAGAAGLSCW
nr:hypothetical protein GCM10020092_095010 [Actinoplanes digitatis]